MSLRCVSGLLQSSSFFLILESFDDRSSENEDVPGATDDEELAFVLFVNQMTKQRRKRKEVPRLPNADGCF